MRERIHVPELRCGFSRWPRGRKVEWYFNDRFSRWLLDSVGVEMREKQHPTALHLMLLGIEVLSGFLEGRQPDLETFSAFVEKYLSPALRTRVKNPLLRRGMAPPALDGKPQLSIAELLWASPRSGYRDACAAFPGASIAEHSHYYVRYYARVGLRIDIRKFHRDFLAGFKRYYADVYSDYLVRQRFLARFDQLFRGKRGKKNGASGRGGAGDDQMKGTQS
jgi:hypothetical protein